MPSTPLVRFSASRHGNKVTQVDVHAIRSRDRGSDYETRISHAVGRIDYGPYQGKNDLIRFRRSNGIIYAGETSSRKQRSGIRKVWAQLCSKVQRRENCACQTLMELRGLVSTALEKGKHIDDYEATAECVTAALNNIERSMNSHEYQAVSRDALALLFDDLLPLLGDPNTERAGERIILWADAAQLNGKAV